MTTFTVLANLGLATMVTMAAVSDAGARRIPNWLVAAGLVIALITQVAVAGPREGGLQWLAGWATGMTLFLGVYLLGGMGAGDVKLMGAVGAFMGPFGAAHVAIVSLLAGGVLALAAMLRHRQSRRSLAALSALLLALPFGRMTTGVARSGVGAKGATDTPAAIRLPYAIAIATGTLLVKWEML